ncbi:retinoblastoma-like protein 1 isoform X2 [Agrilus planipennis]|uniref:Retinoblastoma-like protein 1 isoform X1 n=1 Tax=Agrilus planipennis TaxID=224129 RepID=A0A1W4WTH2_AGRPL|nr:retinoblastoma-like protein 1 isoform X1 [Agrilus planipennis]XP_018323440.1 retinoblastoma-like protein 1 isoform X2 [Agrilus planipennis]
MVLSEDYDNHLYKKYQELCNKLNLDVGTTNQAWESFQSILSNYTLEGDPLHWLGCSIFVACRRTTTLTVGRTVVEGNCVSLTSLLRYCNLSLTQFFNKITKWADMANMPDEFKQKIQRLEGNFAVSYNIFKMFAPIFNEIFKNPTDIEQTKHRNRKQRATPCTSSKVFEFCWILFTTVKGEDPTYSEDLVISYHLLLACCDLAFTNAFLEDRRDLLNPNFVGLPPNWNLPNYTPPVEAHSIIDVICNKHTGIATQAKYDREYSWKKHIRQMFEKGILHGNAETFTGLFDPQNFDANLKNVTRAYETLLLNKGDFDERIFLADYRRRLLLKEQAVSSSLSENELGTVSATDSPLEAANENNSTATTPLKKSLGGRNLSEVTPLTAAIQSVSKLQAMLKGRPPVPSETLIKIFKSCANDPMEKIQNVIEKISEKFRKESNSLPNTQSDYASQRLKTAIVLFYKFIEGIFQRERNSHNDISHLAELDIFYECTLACSLEIIIYSYNCQKKFPWILQALDIQPFDFVRVIELIVRSQDQMPRDAVKHLNMVEQTIIESLIWKSESPIWEAIKKSGDDFPKFEETALPGNLIYTDQKSSVNSSTGLTRFPMSPNLMQSPNASAIDRFQSPIQGSQVKKQLFASNPIRPGQSLLQSSKSILSSNQNSDNLNDLPAGTPSKPKRTGSLSIILRKFYNLAGSRLQHLCELLEFTDIEFHRMIWTVFEHSIREHTYLMKDRHLDQLLMCAVYVVCKVTENVEKGFTEIMRCYRKQPQADSDIYRNVLISREVAPDGTVQSELGDLILFYNSVYVKAMRSFALQFSTLSQDIMLSPLPVLSNQKLTSSRCQVTNNICIKPYEGSSDESGNLGNSLEYHFSRSPSKDLEKINSAISKGVIGKRLLSDENGDISNKKFNRKMQSLMEERRSHLKE